MNVFRQTRAVRATIASREGLEGRIRVPGIEDREPLDGADSEVSGMRGVSIRFTQRVPLPSEHRLGLRQVEDDSAGVRRVHGVREQLDGLPALAHSRLRFTHQGGSQTERGMDSRIDRVEPAPRLLDPAVIRRILEHRPRAVPRVHAPPTG